MKKIIIPLVLLFSNLTVLKAQTGINTRSPNGASITELLSTDKGVLLPRLNITNLADKAPVTATIKDGLLAFNSNAAFSRTLYFWDSQGAGSWSKQLYFKETPKVAVIGLSVDRTLLNNAAAGAGENLTDAAILNNYTIINSGYMPGLTLQTHAGSWDIMVSAGTYTLEISYLLTSPAPDDALSKKIQGNYYNMGIFSDLWITPYNPNTNTYGTSVLSRVEGATLSLINTPYRIRLLHTFEVNTPSSMFALSLVFGRRDGSSFYDATTVLSSGTIIKLTKLR